jgi:hypothetical protein
MELNTKQKVGIAIFVVAGAFATGRYTVPVKTKTEIKTVEVQKIVYRTKKDTTDQRKKKIVIVENKQKDGSETKVTTITDDGTTKSIASNDTTKSDDHQKEEKKEIVKESGHLTISALAGTNFTGIPASQGVLYGGIIQRNLIGPVVIGVWGLSSGTGGASLGLEF